jgi:AcrR family transcriptional regulator
MKSQRPNVDQDKLLKNCLAAFIKAGTLDLSLDQLAASVGISKRMLIHYFGSKQAIEEQAMLRLEETLRARFRADAFPAGATLPALVAALWEQTTRPEARGTLLLIMDVTRRAWSGSKRARDFYREQQRLWEKLLLGFSPDVQMNAAVLQLFQGAVLTYLVTKDREQGTRAFADFFRATASGQKR